MISDEKHFTVSRGDETSLRCRMQEEKCVRNHADGVFLVASKAETGNSRTAGFNRIGRQGRPAV